MVSAAVAFSCFLAVTAAACAPKGPSVVAAIARSGGTDGTEVVVAEIAPGGVDAGFRVDYGTSAAYGSSTAVQAAGSGTAHVEVSATLDGLTPRQTYHYRVVAIDRSTGKENPGADQTFTVRLATPSANSAGPAGAELVTGELAAFGSTTYARVEYGPTTAYGSTTAISRLGTTQGTARYSITVSGLTPGATYHYRVVAWDVDTITEIVSPDRTFTTDAVASTATVSSVDSSAGASSGTEVVGGIANSRGNQTSLRIEYGTSTAYEKPDIARLSGASTLDFAYSFALTGLSPGTTYHYRIVAANMATFAESATQDRTFVAAGARTVPSGDWVVKAIYLSPSDRPAVSRYAAAINEGLRSTQAWYRAQAGKTFTIGTTTPVQCALPHDAAYYAASDSNGSTPNKILAALPSCAGYSSSEHTLWAIYTDVPALPAAQQPGQSLGDACNANRLGNAWVAGYTYGLPFSFFGDGDLQGLAGVRPIGCDGYSDGFGVQRYIGGLGHELGHGFGLDHADWLPDDPTNHASCQYQGATTKAACDALGSSIMGYGYASYPGTFLSPFQVGLVTGSPFFW